jgi:type I restriction enzyme S subunit
MKIITLKKLELYSPPLPLQNHFAEFVRAADKSKFEMQRELDKLELLYKSLMQRCFNGEMFA